MGRERGGGLVHYQNAVCFDCRPRDLNELTIGGTQTLNQRARVDLEPILFQHAGRARIHLGAVDDAEACKAEWLAPEKDVLGHSEFRRQR